LTVVLVVVVLRVDATATEVQDIRVVGIVVSTTPIVTPTTRIAHRTPTTVAAQHAAPFNFLPLVTCIVTASLAEPACYDKPQPDTTGTLLHHPFFSSPLFGCPNNGQPKAHLYTVADPNAPHNPTSTKASIIKKPKNSIPIF